MIFYGRDPFSPFFAIAGLIAWVPYDFFYTSRARVAISNVRFSEDEALGKLSVKVWNWGVSPSSDIVIRPTFHWHDSDIDDEMNRMGGEKISFQAPLSAGEVVEIKLNLLDGFTVENGYRSYLHFLLDCRTSRFWLWRRKNRLRQAFELYEGQWEEVQGGVLRFAISSAKVRAKMKSRLKAE